MQGVSSAVPIHASRHNSTHPSVYSQQPERLQQHVMCVHCCVPCFRLKNEGQWTCSRYMQVNKGHDLIILSPLSTSQSSCTVTHTRINTIVRPSTHSLMLPFAWLYSRLLLQLLSPSIQSHTRRATWVPSITQGHTKLCETKVFAHQIGTAGAP